MSAPRYARLGALLLVSLAAIACGGDAASPEVLPACRAYSDGLAHCFGPDLVARHRLPQTPRSESGRAKIEAYCTAGLERLRNACR